MNFSIPMRSVPSSVGRSLGAALPTGIGGRTSDVAARHTLLAPGVTLLRAGAFVVLGILAAACSGTLHAQTAWTGAGGDNVYSNPGNWAGGVIPGNGSDNGALIGSGATHDVIYSTATSYTSTGAGKANSLLVGTGAGGVGSLTLGGDAGTLTFGGDGYQNAAWLGTTDASGAATGTITVTAGTLSITGGDDASINLGVHIGGSGARDGTLIINGGTVEVGSRILMGANSLDANGTLTISSGALDMKRTGTHGDRGMIRLGAGTNTVNFDGGTAILSGLHISAASNARSDIHFNGTILKANATTTDFIDGTTANANLRLKNGGLVFDTNGYNVTINDALSQHTGHTGILTKLGDGTLTLTGTNTYSGTTTIGGGILRVGDGGTTGTLGEGAVINNGSLVFNRSDNLTVGSAISGTGAVTKLGAGTLTLSGNNTYTGHTIVQAGQVDVTGTITGANTAFGRFIIGAGSGNNGSMRFDMGDGASTFYADRFDDSCDIGENGGTGALVLDSGTLNVATRSDAARGSIRLGVNSGKGTLTVNGGTLNVPGRILMAANGTNPSGTLTINDGEVNLGTAGQGAYGDPGLGLLWTGVGTSAVNLNGGTLALYAFHTTATGTVDVNLDGGTLKAQNHNPTFVGTAGTFNMNVKAGGAAIDTAGYNITLGRALAHDPALGATPDGGLVKLGAGTLTLAAANTYTGNTTVNAGLVTVTGSITGGTAGSRFIIGGTGGTNGAMLFDMGAAGVATFYADGYGNSCDIGQGGGTGELTLDSGTLNVATRASGTRGSIRLGVNGAAPGTLTVNGGVLNVPGRILMAANNAGAAGTLTVNGGEVNLGTAGSGAYGDPGWGLLWTGSGASTINLNGGTLALYGFNGGSGTVNVNLDGGILRAQNNNTTFVTTSGTFNMIVKADGAIIDTAGYNITLGRALAHDVALGATPDGGLLKTGAGALTLAAVNTYTGNTTVTAGSLLVTGSLWASSPVTVEDEASLGGTGTVGGDVSIREGGILAPGGSVGPLTVLGNLTFDAGAFFDVDILGPGNADLLAMSGGLLMPGNATIRVNLGFQPELGDSWTILTGEADRNGIFNEDVALLGGAAFLDGWKRFDISYGSSVILTVVPEPGAGLLLCMTACGLLLRGRRRPFTSNDGANR